MDCLVTVLISAFNSEKFISDSLESICKQTYTNLEILVYNDASTDKTGEIIRSFTELDDRVVLLDRVSNCGLTKNLFEGMTRAKGKYIARMDADDIAMPERIATQVSYMESHPEIDILGTSYYPFDGNSLGAEVKQPESHDEIRCELLLQFTLIHPTVMLRRESFERFGLNYDVSFRYSQDYDLWEKACRTLKAHNLNIPLLKLRSDHPGKITTHLKAPQKECSDRVRKRQLALLQVDLTTDEERVFHEFGSHALAADAKTMELLDSALNKILLANRVTMQYEQTVLEKRAAELFRWNCIAMYPHNPKAFMYYFSSEMQKKDNPSAKVKLILLKYRMMSQKWILRNKGME